MTKPLAIAILGTKGLPSRGGAERVVEALTYRSINYGHKITIYCRKDFTPNDFFLEGVHLIRIPTIQIGFLGFFLYHLLSSIHCFFWGKYDILHFHNVESLFTLPLLKLRFPTICTSHGKVYDTDKWPKILKGALKYCELIFLKVRSIKTCPSLELTKYYNIISKKKDIIYIPNGVELKSLEKMRSFASIDNFLKSNNLKIKNYLTAATNRVLKTKGIEDLIHAYIVSSINYPLIIFGEFENANLDMIPILSKLKERKIILHNRIPGEVLWEVIKNSLIFIFPSYVETMSMMLLEAASIGIPIVYAEIPNNYAIMQKEGIPFEPKNIHDLSIKISEAIDNYEIYLKKARTLSEEIKQKYNWDKIFIKYNQLYLKLSLNTH